MANYKEMYLKLMGEVATITERLIEIQQQMEEMYIMFEDEK